MIPTLFLICALGLPANFSGRHNSHDSKEEFLRDYHYIKDILNRSYPDHEFLIVPEELNITPGKEWVKIYLKWRSHTIYERWSKNRMSA